MPLTWNQPERCAWCGKLIPFAVLLSLEISQEPSWELLACFHDQTCRWLTSRGLCETEER